MLFNFRLFPFSELISEINHRAHPEDEKYQQGIGWYGLTDGWYWIDVGDAHLFRYTLEAGKQFYSPRSSNGLYVDYHVSRFWEDLLQMLPAILEPLPAPLVERLSSVGDWNDWLADRSKVWEIHNQERDEEHDEEGIGEEVIYFYRASEDWWLERCLDTGYLISGPRIWFWSDGVHVHIDWDNRGRLLNAIPAWEAETGRISLPVADFLAELTLFDRLLMASMAERVKMAPDYWTDPQLADTVAYLPEDHRQRALYLAQTLHEAEQRAPTNWSSVLTSIAVIEHDPLFATIRMARGSQ